MSATDLARMMGDLPPLEDIEAEIARRADLKARHITERSIEATRERCRTLVGFVREAWHVLEPSRPYIHNWHIDAICEHLEALTWGKLTPPRLIINVPPGTAKSLLVSVFWNAWLWGPANQPHKRFMSTSYSGDYVKRDTRKTRELIESEWYQRHWGERVKLTKGGEETFINDRMGFRAGKPFERLTGGRGDILTIDDPHSTEGAESDAERKRVIRIFRESVPTRLDDPVKSAIVIIMQRLHVEDVTGVALKLKQGYHHLMLPMEFEKDRACRTVLGFKDPRSYEGELLFPERFPRDEIDRLKVSLGSYAWAGQEQQRPTLREGGLFRRAWFKYTDQLVPGIRWVRRWDLAATAEQVGADPAYTVGLLMGLTPGGQYVIADVKRERSEGAGVRALIKDTAREDKDRYGLVEISLPQDPGQAGKVQAQDMVAMLPGYIVRARPETGNKVTRAEPIAAQAEAGNVFLMRGDWNEAFVDELCDFPGGKYKDQVDCLSGGFAALLGQRIFTMPEEDVSEVPFQFSKTWPLVCAVSCRNGMFGALWGAIDRQTNTQHIFAEYLSPRMDMALHADAIRRAGKWVPVMVETPKGAGRDEALAIAQQLADLGVNVFAVSLDVGAGIETVSDQLAASRLKAFNTCTSWLAQYRGWCRDDKGRPIDENDELMRATALIAMHGEGVGVNEYTAKSDEDAFSRDDFARDEITGY